MPSTNDIEKAARDLGKMIGDHDAAKQFDSAAKSLESDIEAQRLMTDFNRAIQTLTEKQANQQPIEVQDKQKLEKLQTEVAMNLKVRALQQTQMDYMDLMRNVVNTITSEAGGIDPAHAAQATALDGGGLGPSPLGF